MLKKFGNILFAILIILILLIPLITFLRGVPTFAVTIRSFSMEPGITRGDIVLLLPVGRDANFISGQIILFRSEEDGIHDWTLHRINGGSSSEGFITRGDANPATDQASNFPRIKQEWIAGIVPTMGNIPIKIPLLGHIPLLVEQNIQNPAVIFAVIGALVILLLGNDFIRSSKKKKKNSLQSGGLYFMAGLAFAVFMTSVMLMSSLFIACPYGVADSVGALMGSDVGIIEQGATRKITLANLKNEGVFPSFYYAVSSDTQVVLDEQRFILEQGDKAKVNITVHANQMGMYQAKVTIGMFLPFLPFSIIAFLAGLNYWLALIVTSLVPSLPLFLIPALEPRNRRKFVKAWRKRFARIRESIFLPLF